MLLEGNPLFELSGAFPDADNALENIAETRPDVILMDIELPGTSGTDAVRRIKNEYPDLNIIMLTAFDDDDKIFDSVCNGATGYLLKSMQPLRLLEAIEEVHNGGAPMSPVIARKVLRLFAGASVSSLAESVRLSVREKEILTLMVEGMSYKMIAAHCSIGFETVRSHIRHIYEKLQVATMTEAVAKAIRNRLV